MAFIEIEKSVRPSGWSMLNLHSHPHFEIYFLKSGTRSFFLSNALFHLQAPIIIVIPPHTPHKTEGGAFERFNINVSQKYLDEFQREVLQEKALKLLKPTPLEREKITEILETLDEKKPHKYASHITHTLFSYLIYLISDLKQDESLPFTATKNSMPPVLLKVLDYLNANYQNKLTLSSIADEFYIPKTSLSYTFKKYMDCSLIDYLLFLRIMKAKEYLLNTKKSIEEIAELCGFSSANYFGLIFKQKEHLSPMQYRKHQRMKELY